MILSLNTLAKLLSLRGKQLECPINADANGVIQKISYDRLSNCFILRTGSEHRFASIHRTELEDFLKTKESRFSDGSLFVKVY